jgi:hypothetical protein
MTELEIGFWAQHRLREQREAAAIRRMLRATGDETGSDRSWRDRLAVALTRRTARRAEAS